MSENIKETSSGASGAMQLPFNNTVEKHNEKFHKVIHELEGLLEAKSISKEPNGDKDADALIKGVEKWQTPEKMEKSAEPAHGYSNRDRVENYSGGMTDWTYDYAPPKKFKDNIKKTGNNPQMLDLMDRAIKRKKAETKDSKPIIRLGSNFQFDPNQSGAERTLAFEGQKIAIVNLKAETIREAFEKTPQAVKSLKKNFGVITPNQSILFEYNGNNFKAKVL